MITQLFERTILLLHHGTFFSVLVAADNKSRVVIVELLRKEGLNLIGSEAARGALSWRSALRRILKKKEVVWRDNRMSDWKELYNDSREDCRQFDKDNCENSLGYGALNSPHGAWWWRKFNKSPCESFCWWRPDELFPSDWAWNHNGNIDKQVFSSLSPFRLFIQFWDTRKTSFCRLLLFRLVWKSSANGANCSWFIFYQCSFFRLHRAL